jgi:hypothetical protein
MSKGLGRVERVVVGLVNEPSAAATVGDGRFGTTFDGTGAVGIMLRDLVRQVAGEEPSASATESVRRAVRSLVRDGRLEVKRGFPRDRRGRYSHYVRRLPTDAERERRSTADAEARAWSAALGARRGATLHRRPDELEKRATVSPSSRLAERAT